MKLVTHNLGGNLHEAAIWLNDFNLADAVLALDCARGTHTIVVLRVADDFELESHLKANNDRAREARKAREVTTARMKQEIDRAWADRAAMWKD